MMRIVQICPEIGPGSGVAGVAHNLEREWQRLGVQTERFTMAQARGGWLPQPGPGIHGRLVLLARVVWFSTVGTLLARRYLRRHPDAVSICHNDALAGDVYVNHGIVQAAMRARGTYRWRMIRNPVHMFTTMRDAYRYGSRRVHRVVVNLVAQDGNTLREVYPRVAVPTTVVGNGVDVEAFRPPTGQERAQARDRLRLGPSDFVVLFVGHEYERKGLPLILAALQGMPESVVLLVVGGTADMTAELAVRARELGLEDRLRIVGAVPDPRPYLHASDVFCLPSAYEAYPLVVLEALACGLPVVASATGCVPDLIVDGINGYVVDRQAAAIREALTAVHGLGAGSMAAAARETAEKHSWDQVAREYLALINARLTPSPSGAHG